MSVAIDSLDLEGRGVGRIDGKVVFVEGALPGEQVRIETWRRKPSFDLANLAGIEHPSALRVMPRCRHYERCGGCSLQHLDERAQVAIKQRVLEDSLARIGKVSPEAMLPPIHGPAWGYRHRARLSVKHVERKGGVLVGFHERRTHYVVEMDSCEVLPARVSALIRPLRELISGLHCARRLAQIEVAMTDKRVALVLRILDPLHDDDAAALRSFARAHAVEIHLQPKGPASVYPLEPGVLPELVYALPEFGLEFAFKPTEFTQVNHAVNRVLVRRAVALLEPEPGERIGDLFCGLGNFSLALARRGAQVTGVEGSRELVDRARENAARNGLEALASFRSGDLFRDARGLLASLPRLDKLLIDPPRDGAHALVEALGEQQPARIVYVSCSPATLARDAGILHHEKGYQLKAAGVVNMFPHTSHVESIALFERGATPARPSAPSSPTASC
jgi:23S rRNA (uracil1939-C5)-methyltransferase